MTTPSDLLWRTNNEYQKRLKQAKTYLSLLEQLVIMQGRDAHTLNALHHALDQIDTLNNEHRDWRYRYYYESLETRRMVQSIHAVHQALAHFSRMRARHQYNLNQIETLLLRLQRPDPVITQTPTGDLWQMTQHALIDLNHFDDYMQSLTVNS